VKRFFIFIVGLLFFHQQSPAQDSVPKLSDEARISLITFSPGDPFYTAFGHTAFRVTDPVRFWDESYNYGTFDFDDPNFYLNFVRGKLRYVLNRESFDLTYRTYVYFDRSITEQVLDLSQDQKQHLFEYLEHNSLPENRFYYYDFFYDNCSTRPLTAIQWVLGDQYNSEYKGDPRTFRQVVQERGAEQPWTRLGAQFLLGSPTDVGMTKRSSNFLPDNLFYELASAQNGNKPLVLRTDTLFAESSPRVTSGIAWPFWIFLAVFIVGFVLTMLYLKNKTKWHRSLSWFDSILFFAAGVAGLVLFDVVRDGSLSNQMESQFALGFA